MKQMLKDKVAVITGGTAGIGREMAKAFAEHGATVIIFGRNQERGNQVVAELNEVGTSDKKSSFCAVDVGQTKDVEEAINKIIAEHGAVDILVNNAGITRDSLMMRLTEEMWDDVIDTNLKAAYNTCKAVCRPMMKARSGKIINISSVVGLIGNAGQAHYAASKSGLIGLSKSLAREWASRGINVNCIAPGFIETPMTDVLNDQQKEAVLGAIPMKRMGAPREIANAALFLASDWSNYITGQTITVDGGMVM